MLGDSCRQHEGNSQTVGGRAVTGRVYNSTNHSVYCPPFRDDIVIKSSSTQLKTWLVRALARGSDPGGDMVEGRLQSPRRIYPVYPRSWTRPRSDPVFPPELDELAINSPEAHLVSRGQDNLIPTRLEP